ncbi:helix-turn-helix transcriptional regulator [Kitasatospora sp. GAS204B]|uniref:helix-turn-helix domain-containing protein n=1 Tax=unclassified Kitasatospora TaxID=2633591 RepID=UPI0024765E25|nr:helix-turn-helix transcriptional regulator [Kitasatospora sp. GAS204B]MDH6119585.1 transcriptional regulator with XRE-family HTH domain [Kitasatospora sp. GAS204B]
MALRTNPTLRQRRLGTELRRMREQAGLGGSQLARQLGINPAHVTQMESGKTGLSVERLYTIAGMCMCDNQPLLEALADVIADRGKGGWWEEYRGVLPVDYLEVAELEGHAKRIASFAMVYIPGLLQTRSYASALFARGPLPLLPQEVDLRTTFRLRRQQVVRSGGTPYLALVHEAALRGQYGGRDVLIGQLASLVEDYEHPGISIRIVPFEVADFPIPSEDLTHLTGPVPELDTVQADASYGSHVFDLPAHLSRYRATLEHIRSVALSEDESRSFIRSIMEEMQNRHD